MVRTIPLLNIKIVGKRSYGHPPRLEILMSLLRVRWFSASARALHGNAMEMAHFAELANSWWDPNGPQRILHKMNLMRMDFIQDVLKQSGNAARPAPGYSLDLLPAELREKYAVDANKRYDVLDVGCGGGLLSESLARRPFVRSVTGIDVTPEVVEVARNHKRLDPTLDNLQYELSAVEELNGDKKFDIITMFEVLEHLDDPADTLRQAMSLVRPGGYIFLSTINRTVASYLTTIFVAENVLKIVPKGTHTLSKYINEDELRTWIDEQPDWKFVASEGCLYVPFQGWQRFGPKSQDAVSKALDCAIGKTGGNYLMAARKL